MRAGMVSEYDSLPCGRIYVRINLRSQYAFMAEHLLHRPQIRTVGYQVGSERMPE